MSKRFASPIILSVIVLLLTAVCAQCKIIYVKPTGNDYKDGLSWATARRSFLYALRAAVAGDEVWVAAGTYSEMFNLKNGVGIYGGFAGTETSRDQRNWSQNVSIIKGYSSSYSTISARSGITASAVLDGFTICDGSVSRSSSTVQCSTIYLIGGSPTLSNNIITRNNAMDVYTGSSYYYGYGGAIYCSGSSPVIYNNVFTGNSAYQGGAIYICNSSSPVIVNNTFAGNYAYQGGAIFCDSSSATIANNIIAFNSSGIFKTSALGNVTLQNNDVYNPDGDNYSGLSAGLGDISADPKFVAVEYGQVHIQADSPCIDKGDDAAMFTGSTDIDAQPRINGEHVDLGADESYGENSTYRSPVVYVSPSGNDANDGSSWATAKKTIQAGINAASLLSGEVWVMSSIYNERINMKPYAHLYGGFSGNESEKSARNISANKTILDGGAAGTVVTASYAGHLTAGIDGFVIRNGKADFSSAGIYFDLSAITIANNVILENAGAGISFDRSVPKIFNNVITQNQGGISSIRGTAVIVNNTLVANCSSAIYIEAGTVANNICAFNRYGIGTSSSSPGAVQLRNNNVYNPDGVNYSGVTPGEGDIVGDPKLVAAGYGDVHLRVDSPLIDKGWDAAAPGDIDMDGQGRTHGEHIDIGADESYGEDRSFTPAIIYVSPSGSDANDGLSWTSSKLTVQAGIDSAATSGGEVWVAGGVYKELITVKPYVHLYGGFAGTENSISQRDWKANRTVIDGTFSGRVVNILGTGHLSTGVDGFSIINGKDNSTTQPQIAGIACLQGCPLIENNYLTGHVKSGTSEPNIISCAYIIAKNNIVSKNQGNGIVCQIGKVINNVTENNSGCGIYCGSGSTIHNNFVVGNGMGGIRNYGGSTASNNTVVGNSNSGIQSDARSTAVNNLVAFNDIGFSCTDNYYRPVLKNNCVYNPEGINYQNITPGEGDILADPKLASPQYGQYHIQSDSPCIDKGLDSGIAVGELDIDGEARINGDHVDLGADEYYGETAGITPSIVYVSPLGDDANDGLSWTAAKGTVQAGIDAAADRRGEVWVAAGTYNERIALKQYAYVYGGFNGTETDKSARNWAANKTIIDGGSAGTVVVARGIGHLLTAIDGFTIRHGKGDVNNGSAIHCYQASPAIRNNIIAENDSATGGAGVLMGYAHPEITDNIIRENIGNGLESYRSSGARVLRNKIMLNSEDGYLCNDNSSDYIANNIIDSNIGAGISCDYTSPVIYNNTLVRNGIGISIHEDYGYPATPSITNNIVAYCRYGISNNYGSPVLKNNCIYNPDGFNYVDVQEGEGDIHADPRFTAAEYGELHIQPDSPCLNKGLDGALTADDTDIDGQPRIHGEQIDIGADESYEETRTFAPTIIYVSPLGDDANDGSTWSSAKKTMQAGIEAASLAGGEVWVAGGTYKERITIRPYAYLYGGFAGTESAKISRDWKANKVTLDAETGGSVVTAFGMGCANSCLDGFTITNGKAQNGGGICVGQEWIYTPFNIQNCDITGNTATSYGGGIYGSYAYLKLSNTLIKGNIAINGGGIYLDDSYSTDISNCSILENAASSAGGGIYAHFFSGRLSGCSIAGNIATQSGGGIWQDYSDMVICNSIIARNSAAGGGGISGSYVCDITLINNTIVYNTVTQEGGALSSIDTVNAYNNIIAFNSSGIYKQNSSGSRTWILKNNCFYNPSGYNFGGIASPGVGDIYADPHINVDYHLTPASLCINAGYQDALEIPEFDYDLQPRIQGGTIDIGADEYWPVVESAQDAKSSGDNVPVAIKGAVVTAAFPGFFYIESDNRISGIRVEKVAHGVEAGMRADVTGVVSSNANGERCILADTVLPDGTGSVAPLSLINTALGGGKIGYQDGVWGWKLMKNSTTGKFERTWAPASGLNTIGLLLRVWGRIVNYDPSTSTLTIDDGSRTLVECVLPAGEYVNPNWNFVAVTGISSCRKEGSELKRTVLVRSHSDITAL